MEHLKNKFQIVVARYNEDISWLLPYKDVTTIYNKGDYIPLLSKFNTIQLNNVGRESHTYLYHIINNYDNLKEKTIFFQGNISDHAEKILDIEDYFQDNNFIGKMDNYEINKLKNEITHFGKYKKDLKQGNLKKCDSTPYDWITQIIGVIINPDLINTKVVWNANFSVSKDLILSKPKSFYTNILRYINHHPNPEEGHFLERSWYLIFHNQIIQKPLIKFIISNNYNDNNKIFQYFKNTHEEIHLWLPIYANINLNDNLKINFLKSILKYITIYPTIFNNNFEINIKAKSDISLLIEFEKDESCNESDPDYNNKIEIILGGWSNTRSILRDYNNNKIINSYEKETLDYTQFIKFNFDFNNNLLIKKNNEIIFNSNHISTKTNIKNISIKNNTKNDISLDYIQPNNINTNNIKIHLFNNYYEEINDFYRKNYLNNYIEQINFINML